MKNIAKNTLLGLFSLVLSFSAFGSTAFYTIDTNQSMSEAELATRCANDRDQVAIKLAEISKRLSAGDSSALKVNAIYQILNSNGTPVDPSVPPNPSANYEYTCVLLFDSNDSSIRFEATVPAMFDHLKKETWSTACKPAYDSAVANENSPATLYWKSWTLFQGRICEVTTLTVLKAK